MSQNVYGYCRVSSRDQNEDRQLIAMLDVKVPQENIFVDKQSGKDFERTQYKKLVKKLRRDDLLYIKSIDRLAIRQRQAEGIAAAKSCGVRFGRPPKPLPAGFLSACKRWKAGLISETAAALECGMPLSTFRYHARRCENRSR